MTCRESISSPPPSANSRLRKSFLLSFLALALPCVGNIEAAPAAYTHTIYLVRHGAYVQDPKADPAVGGDLTPLGIAQARLVAARLRGLPFHFDSMTSSPFARARETSAIIHDSLTEVPLQLSPDVGECSPPTFTVSAEVSADDAAACAKRLDSAFQARFTPATTADRHDLIVAHGSVIRYFATKALGIDTRAWNSLFIAHTSITVIEISGPGAYKVLSIGDIGHVPPNLQSWGTSADPQLTLPH